MRKREEENGYFQNIANNGTKPSDLFFYSQVAEVRKPNR